MLDISLIGYHAMTESKGSMAANISSVDFLYRWKPLKQGEWNSFLFGGQVFFVSRRFLDPIDTDADGINDDFQRMHSKPKDYFMFAQYQTSLNTFVGVRYDHVESIADEAIKTKAIHPYISLYTTEFMRLRFGTEHRWSDDPIQDGANTIFVELNFVIGAHPPEPFWVNK